MVLGLISYPFCSLAICASGWQQLSEWAELLGQSEPTPSVAAEHAHTQLMDLLRGHSGAAVQLGQVEAASPQRLHTVIQSWPPTLRSWIDAEMPADFRSMLADQVGQLRNLTAVPSKTSNATSEGARAVQVVDLDRHRALKQAAEHRDSGQKIFDFLTRVDDPNQWRRALVTQVARWAAAHLSEWALKDEVAVRESLRHLPLSILKDVETFSLNYGVEKTLPILQNLGVISFPARALLQQRDEAPEILIAIHRLKEDYRNLLRMELDSDEAKLHAFFATLPASVVEFFVWERTCEVTRLMLARHWQLAAIPSDQSLIIAYHEWLGDSDS